MQWKQMIHFNLPVNLTYVQKYRPEPGWILFSHLIVLDGHDNESTFSSLIRKEKEDILIDKIGKFFKVNKTKMKF